MTPFRPLTEMLSVAPQLSTDDVKAAAAAGFRTILNNRPDGEAPGQPRGAEIAAAAGALGLGYVTIPIDHSGFSAEQVAAMQKALAGPGPILAYCRTGTRSTMLWALAAAANGMKLAEIETAATKAGYDVAPLVPMLRKLGAKD